MRSPRDRVCGVCARVLFSVQRSWRGLSEAHAHPPRVVRENFVFFLHDAGVCAFVDGIGHYSYVVVFQGDVVWVGVLQQLAVLVPVYFAFFRCYFLPTTKGKLFALDDQLVFGPRGCRGGSHSGEREFLSLWTLPMLFTTPDLQASWLSYQYNLSHLVSDKHNRPPCDHLTVCLKNSRSR